jgi:hypothetical protein
MVALLVEVPKCSALASWRDSGEGPVYDFKKNLEQRMKYLTLLFAVLVLSSCGKSQMPADPLHAAAAQTCKDTIEARAINRKSVNYLSVEVAPAAKEELNVTIKVSAKNEIGMASTLLAKCIVSVDGKSLVGINVVSQ